LTFANAAGNHRRINGISAFRVIASAQTRRPATRFPENEQGGLPVRRRILTCLLASTFATGCHPSNSTPPAPQIAKDAVQITKLASVYASHTFDRAAPPANMPPLGPNETAVCDADFLARSNVRGQPHRSDATHATLTITGVVMTLQLQINVWLPTEFNQTVADHEQGHRQIAEYYYQTADKLAERIASTYIGKRVEVSGPDLDAEFNKALLEVATEITNEYTTEINSNPTQLLYDDITDHARNGVIVKDAVDHAIKNAAVEAAPAAK
jgi:hypothetical protein